jgi:hypothetical protein
VSLIWTADHQKSPVRTVGGNSAKPPELGQAAFSYGLANWKA